MKFKELLNEKNLRKARKKKITKKTLKAKLNKINKKAYSDLMENTSITYLPIMMQDIDSDGEDLWQSVNRYNRDDELPMVDNAIDLYSEFATELKDLTNKIAKSIEKVSPKSAANMKSEAKKIKLNPKHIGYSKYGEDWFDGDDNSTIVSRMEREATEIYDGIVELFKDYVGQFDDILHDIKLSIDSSSTLNKPAFKAVSDTKSNLIKALSKFERDYKSNLTDEIFDYVYKSGAFDSYN